MKIFVQILFTVITIPLFGQVDVAGFYEFKNCCTYRQIDLKADSTFSWNYNSDMHRESRTGVWEVNSDTLILNFNSDTLIGEYWNKIKGNFIDTAIYGKELTKWLITDSKRLNTHYRTSQDTVDGSVLYMPSYYNRLLEYNSDGVVIKEYKYCYKKGIQTLCLETGSFQNGIKKYILEFNSKGEKDGTEIVFYSNGAIKLIGRWKKGRRVGKWKYFKMNGKIEKVLNGKEIKTNSNTV